MNMPISQPSSAETPQAPDLAVPAGDFVLHPHDMTIDAEGVHPCLWPMPLEELESVRDRFLLELFTWFRAQDVDRDRDVELIWLNAGAIGMEFTRLIHAWVVLQRLQERGFPLSEGQRDDGLFTNLAAGRAPTRAVYASETMAGLPADPLWRKFVRGLRYALNPGAICYRPPALISRDEDLVTFSLHALITEHARQSGRRLVVSKFADWMTTGDITHRAANGGATPTGREAVISLMRCSFAEKDCPMPDFLVQHCDAHLKRLTAWAQVYLDDVLRREKHLPKHFWSGSSGILQNRVMARAVQRAGGETTGHDHSSSSGWWSTPLRTVVELNYVDRFATYGEAIARDLRRDIEPSLLVRPDRVPEITAIARPAEGAGPRAAEPARPGTDGRGLMYVMTAYTGNFGGLWPIMADPVAVDWQTRLLAQLDARGYDITIKPNPDSHCAPPSALQELFKVRTVEGPCETVMPEADMLLFDYPASTCFLAALRTDRPIVYIDFPFTRLNPEARALLERRVAVVRGRLDASGRAQIDWSELDAALKAAPGLMDQGFVESYFPSY